MNSKTYCAHPGILPRQWHLIDLNNQVLGRVSTRIAMILMGKSKATYTPSVDCGDYVVAVNVDKIRLTGNKLNQKMAFHHTLHPGGGRLTSYKKLMQENPEKALFLSVKKMLPKNKLSSRQILRLKMYKGTQHPHAAQMSPIPEKIKETAESAKN